MDFALTPQQRAFRADFEDLCRRRIAPRARETDRAGALPAENWRELVAAGYPRLFHAPALGGTGADGITLAIAMEALARACASTFWSVTISAAVCGKVLSDLCRPHHHDHWLRPILAGQRIGCFAGTESGAGSDPPGSYHTALIRSDRGLRLHGEKTCISNAGIADVAVVLARTDAATGASGPSGWCFVVVDLHAAGVHRSELEKLGLAGMSLGTLRFEDVAISEEDAIFEADMESNLRAVEWGQLLQTFCAIGLADAALAAALEHARARPAFGRPIAHLPAVHGRLADVHAELEAARLLAYEAAWHKGQGRAGRDLVVMAKIYAAEMSVRAADVAMRTFGGRGYTRDHDVERLYRDSLANVPAGLTTDRLRELLVCPALGVDPWQYPPFDWLTAAGLAV